MEYDTVLNPIKQRGTLVFWLPASVNKIKKQAFHKKRAIHPVFLSIGYRKLKKAKAGESELVNLTLPETGRSNQNEDKNRINWYEIVTHAHPAPA
jgi:hypothetical protein